MKNLLFLSLMFLTACASATKPSPPVAPQPPIVDSDAARIEHALRSEMTAIVSDDDLEIKGDLKIPEIEKIRSQGSPDGLNALNGNVCVELAIRSGKSVNYAGANWTFLMTVDRKIAKTEAIVTSPAQGRTMATVCTKKIYSTVKHVILSIKEKKNSFAAFDWHQPWPPLHQSEK